MELKLSDLDWIESHDLLAGIVLPRPIAFVSTVGEDGVFNIAPYSFYGAMSVQPAIVYIGIGAKVRQRQKKDTIRNIEFSNDFVVNIVDEILAEQMNQSSADYASNVDEFKEVGLTAGTSDLVKAPRIAESPVSMECKVRLILKFGEFPKSTDVVLGEVLKVHIKDELWIDNEMDTSELKAIGRLGKQLFCRTRDSFEMKRPYELGQ